jgi:hypothetical protein
VRDQHALDRVAQRIALQHRRLGQAAFEIAQDDQAFLDDRAALGLQYRQRGGAARAREQPVGARPGDVDHVEIDRIARILQREQDLEPLRERADRDVVDDRFSRFRRRAHSRPLGSSEPVDRNTHREHGETEEAENGRHGDAGGRERQPLVGCRQR